MHLAQLADADQATQLKAGNGPFRPWEQWGQPVELQRREPFAEAAADELVDVDVPVEADDVEAAERAAAQPEVPEAVNAWCAEAEHSA